MAKIKAIVFDSNETRLDLTALDPGAAKPDVRGATLGEVAESIIREDR